MLKGRVELGYVEADELYAKAVGQRLWMAMPLAVPSRLWLGGMVSDALDSTLITAVVRMVLRAANSPALLVYVDGPASYVTAFKRVFRDPIRTGRRARPHLAAIPGLLSGQVIKHRAGRRLVSVTRRVVLGTACAVAAVLAATGAGTGINTAYIERLNAMFRAAACPLVRRGRALAREAESLTGWSTFWAARTTSVGSTTSLRTPAAAGGRLK